MGQKSQNLLFDQGTGRSQGFVCMALVWPERGVWWRKIDLSYMHADDVYSGRSEWHSLAHQPQILYCFIKNTLDIHFL